MAECLEHYIHIKRVSTIWVHLQQPMVKLGTRDNLQADRLNDSVFSFYVWIFFYPGKAVLGLLVSWVNVTMDIIG